MLQVNGVASTIQEVQESVGPVFVDPRSPTVGIVRTPLKDSMKGIILKSITRLHQANLFRQARHDL